MIASRQLRTTCLILGVLASGIAGTARAGHREGTGGDYVRATFLRMGKAVVEYLRTTDEGRALADQRDLDVNALAATLTIDVVKVSATPLRDDGGSAVDAVGLPGSITLAQNAWAEYFESERDVYFLVFHEMLRAARVNDDDYVISGGARPFPRALQVATSIMTREPLIAEDDLASYFDVTGIAVNGGGCPSGYGTLVDLDARRNILELRVREFGAVEAGPGLPLSLRRRNCQVSIPVNVPAGKRLVITQVDAAAEVDLPARGAFTLTASAYFSGTSTQATSSKTVTAGTTPLKGRTLQRTSGAILATTCGGPARPLNVNLSGNATPGTSGTAVGTVLGASLYLQLQKCP